MCKDCIYYIPKYKLCACWWFYVEENGGCSEYTQSKEQEVE